jgi:hypothetical protein
MIQPIPATEICAHSDDNQEINKPLHGVTMRRKVENPSGCVKPRPFQHEGPHPAFATEKTTAKRAQYICGADPCPENRAGWRRCSPVACAANFPGVLLRPPADEQIIRRGKLVADLPESGHSSPAVGRFFQAAEPFAASASNLHANATIVSNRLLDAFVQVTYYTPAHSVLLISAKHNHFAHFRHNPIKP